MKIPGKRSWAANAMIVLGILLILAGISVFVGLRAWIWTTNREASRHQSRLLEEWQNHPLDPPPAEGPFPEAGSGIALLEIPAIGLAAVVVELEGLDDLENLRKGPGHVPATAYPGEEGNVVIAGHRTTYGAPFNRLDDLRPGDPVFLHVASRSYVYRVEETFIVEPSDLSVLEQSGPPRLTLTSCHPEFRSSQRIVVVAALETSEE